jgi:BTB/POZ domain
MPDTRATKRARVEKATPEAPEDVTMVDTAETMGKEEEGGVGDEDFPERCDLVWYEDGNVILQAERRQFRVHKSVLSKHSTVLRDMFRSPQPLPTPENALDGCQIFIMEGDFDYHWEELLRLLYDGQR